MATVMVHSDFGAQENEIVTASTFSICHEGMELVAMILVFFNVEFQVSFFTVLFHPYQEAL